MQKIDSFIYPRVDKHLRCFLQIYIKSYQLQVVIAVVVAPLSSGGFNEISAA
jgi:hypothetical protein